MPTQKKASEEEDDDLLPPYHRDNFNEHLQDEDEKDSDRNPSSSEDDKDDKNEFVSVKLSDIRKEVQCPICLGIIKKTRTVMECLHRFCRECIDKSMRLGNNECPACRTHCASRRSLRDDPNYDALIAALYPDIDKYEEEELAFQEEEKARNKQIQSSIAQTLRRQSEVLGKKRPKYARKSSFRGRKNYRNAIENQGFDDNEDINDNDASKGSSSTDERIEPKSKRCRRRGPVRFYQSCAATGADGCGDENDFEVNKETIGASMGLVGSSESQRLAWGKGGMRSHTRYGSMNGGNSKISRTSRFTRLVDHLRNSENIHQEYVALQTALPVDVVEIYVVKELQAKLNSLTQRTVVDPSKDNMQILSEQETLTELKTQILPCGYLLLAYQKKG